MNRRVECCQPPVPGDITGPSHLGVYGPCGFIRCVIEKVKKTAQVGSESSAFDGRVLLGLDRLGLNPVSQRHVTSGSRAGVWLIGCDPTDETARYWIGNGVLDCF